MSSDRETVAVYDAKAADYQNLVFSDAEKRALERFVSALAPGAEIFDLGCGPGLHAAAMVERGFRVSALDASSEFVAAARARGIDAAQGTFDDFDADGAYDAVWASFSLLHAPKADFPGYLRAIRKALRPGGHLFLGLKLGEGEQRDDLGRFYAYYAEDELLTLLDEAGFALDWAETDVAKGLAGTDDPFILIGAHA